MKWLVFAAFLLWAQGTSACDITLHLELADYDGSIIVDTCVQFWQYTTDAELVVIAGDFTADGIFRSNFEG